MLFVLNPDMAMEWRSAMPAAGEMCWERCSVAVASPPAMQPITVVDSSMRLHAVISGVVVSRGQYALWYGMPRASPGCGEGIYTSSEGSERSVALAVEY